MGKTAFVLNVVDHIAVRKIFLHGVQSGDVQGAAGEPNALHGVQGGFPEAEDGNLSDSDWDAVVEESA